jgi:RNA polymerase sigma-70 factor (sigma-E family)
MAHTGTLADVERGTTDAVSIETLYRAHGTWLVRVARMFVADRAAAEDIVQEAFIRFHRSRRRLKAEAAAAGYLRSTVLNLARDHNRRGLVSTRHLGSHPIGSVGLDPDDALIVDEENTAVIEAVAVLPPRQRDCVVLRYYLELSYQEIAETLGLSVNSIKTHLKRGLATLRLGMEDHR